MERWGRRNGRQNSKKKNRRRLRDEEGEKDEDSGNKMES
jgi:hypothetical protein